MADPVAEPAQLSRLPQIRENEPHWIWKAGIRAILCIIDIVAIGCAAWLITSAVRKFADDELGFEVIPGTSAGSVVVLSVAFVWCLLFLTIPFILKPPRPIHPGWAVGGDLLLWMGFIVVALFTTATIFNVVNFGSDGVVEDPTGWFNSNYQGEYYLAPNNTWVYNVTSVYDRSPGFYNDTTGIYTYPTLNTSTVVRDCTPEFTSCVQQDAFVNRMWHEKSRLAGTTIVVAAVEWLGVLFHFILFVWACVDTHRYNAKKRLGTDQLVADRIIQDLEKRGLIQVKNGVVVSVGGTPNNATHTPATAPLLSPNQLASHGSTDAITPV